MTAPDLTRDKLVEIIARAIWERRRAFAAESDIALEPFGDGTIPRASGVYGEAAAALAAIAKHAAIVPREATSEIKTQAWWCFGDPTMTTAEVSQFWTIAVARSDLSRPAHEEPAEAS